MTTVDAAVQSLSLAEIRQYLERIGYAELCATFNPLKPRTAAWAKAVDCLVDRQLASVVKLLLLGKSVDKGEFDDTALAYIGPLIEFGIVDDDGSRLQTRNLVLYVVLGAWLFFDLPSVNPRVYYGDDSFALVNRLRPVQGGRTLDLCSGPGIQSLYCARVAREVVSVEINPFASSIAIINRELNGATNWQVNTGDLYDALDSGQTFDHVVCNPPLLPFPDDTRYPFVGHGGEDGWRIAWRVLDGLPAILRATGHAQLIGTTLGNGVEPIIADRLHAFARDTRMNCHLCVVAHVPLARGSEYFEGLAWSAAVAENLPVDTVRERLEAFLVERDATHLVSHYLRVTHGTGDVQVVDLVTDDGPAVEFWYR
jgi:SAM-dependent methyltransferase